MKLLFLKEQDIKMKEIYFRNGGPSYDFFLLLLVIHRRITGSQDFHHLHYPLQLLHEIGVI